MRGQVLRPPQKNGSRSVFAFLNYKYAYTIQREIRGIPVISAGHATPASQGLPQRWWDDDPNRSRGQETDPGCLRGKTCSLGTLWCSVRRARDAYRQSQMVILMIYFIIYRITFGASGSIGNDWQG